MLWEKDDALKPRDDWNSAAIRMLQTLAEFAAWATLGFVAVMVYTVWFL